MQKCKAWEEDEYMRTQKEDGFLLALCELLNRVELLCESAVAALQIQIVMLMKIESPVDGRCVVFYKTIGG